VHCDASLQADLRRHRLSDVIGEDHIFDTLREALIAIREQRLHAVSIPGKDQIAR
jgi:hypothetical protein